MRCNKRPPVAAVVQARAAGPDQGRSELIVQGKPVARRGRKARGLALA
jgi:hypothetical protein